MSHELVLMPKLPRAPVAHGAAMGRCVLDPCLSAASAVSRLLSTPPDAASNLCSPATGVSRGHQPH